MSTSARVFFLLLVVGLLAWLAYTGQPLAWPDLGGGKKAEPTKPSPDEPKKPLIPRPFREAAEDAVGAITVGGPVGPGGTEVTCDLPLSLRTRNVGGSDGAGLCVFTSIGHAARWQSEPVLKDFQQWMRSKPGGGYPDKVDTMIARLSKEKGQEVRYLQYEGHDPLPIIEAALKTGRLPSITYNGRDPHYRGTIAHMVNCVYLDANVGAILDNNFVGENELVWLSRDELRSRCTGGANGWVVVLLDEAPAPIPSN